MKNAKMKQKYKNSTSSTTDPDIQFDGTLDICTGTDRRTKTWKSKEVTWSALVKKLSVTKRTPETFAEYQKFPKEKRDEIKDVGGIVGGHLVNGRRKPENVLHRQLLTFDSDYATKNFWADFTMFFDCAACLYSTHSHSPESPRVRLTIPLDREVAADEYQAIARKVAEMLGIEQFDSTTFQPERLMYWPSTSIDGEYLFEFQDGPWLSADFILSMYADWKDAAHWPIGKDEKEKPLREAKKQGDPRDKPGNIGAFNRAFSVSNAIEKFLGEIYAPTTDENRFTYIPGSTAGGLIIYDDDLFAYSQHGTDPARGRLCSAFDLVRIHKFGTLDGKEYERIEDAPSQKAMLDFAATLDEVKLEIVNAKIQSVQEDFSDDITIADNSDDAAVEKEDWRKEIQVDAKGNIKGVIRNLYLFLSHLRGLRGALRFDEFNNRLIWVIAPPWRKNGKGSDFNEVDLDYLRDYLESAKVPTSQIESALSLIKNENRYHPVREYLNGLHWDGVPRIENLLIEFLGAEPTAYTREVTLITLIGAVARIFEPGCKFDTVLTLVGREGTGKSTFWARLGRQWFSDCLGDIHKKDGPESLIGVWILEIAEMFGLRRADQEAAKRFLSSVEDVFRPAYGRFPIRSPRQCIFVATTNDPHFLQNIPGNRRFLPIRVCVQAPTRNLFTDLTEDMIGRIWGEAVALYRSGAKWHLPAEMENHAATVRESFTDYDERTGIIREYLEMAVPTDWKNLSDGVRKSYLAAQKYGVQTDDLFDPGADLKPGEWINEISVSEILADALGYNAKEAVREAKAIHKILQGMKGWEPAGKTRRGDFGVVRIYRRIDPKKWMEVVAADESERQQKATSATISTQNKTRTGKSVADVAAKVEVKSISGNTVTA